MSKASRSGKSTPKGRAIAPVKSRARQAAPKPAARTASAPAETGRVGWATDLVFDVREPKLAVSLRLDADVLRFFRGFGAGYQTRINEVLKAFMHARGGAQPSAGAVAGARASRSAASNGKRAR
jgi:uncharacterized protein (DUF4415 family)